MDKQRRDVAIIILYNKDKKILLQHRSNDAKRLAGYWGFFGGAIEKGETPENAVKREAFEELKYNLVTPDLVMVQKFIGNHTYGTKYVFMKEFDASQKLTLTEGQAMKWLTINETKDLKIAEHDKEVLEYIKNKL